MGALRKAAVWLGLVEEQDDDHDDVLDDEFAEDDFAQARPRPASRSRRRSERDIRSYDREATDDRGLRSDRTGRDYPGRSRHFDSDRDDPRAERDQLDRAEPRRDHATVRHLARPSSSAPVDPSRDSASDSGWPSSRDSSWDTSGYRTQNNLALAPQAAQRETPSREPQVRDTQQRGRDVRDRAANAEEKGRHYQITTLHPTTYREARAIGEYFREGYPVIINLTDMDEPDAKRVVDFAAGLAFGLRGSMERVTNRVFLLSPANVQVSAEDKARIAEGDFFDRS